MTKEEQDNNPSHKTTGGFLRKTNRMDWTKLTEENIKFIKSLPNYDDKVFKQITGISLKNKCTAVKNKNKPSVIVFANMNL